MKVTITVDRERDGPETFYAVAHATDLYAMIREFDEELRQMSKHGSGGVDEVAVYAIRDVLYRKAEEYDINLHAGE